MASAAARSIGSGWVFIISLGVCLLFMACVFSVRHHQSSTGPHLPNSVMLTALGLGCFSSDFRYSPTSFR